jgi:hypothetical protein
MVAAWFLIAQGAGRSQLWVICPVAIDVEEPSGNRTPLPFFEGPHTQLPTLECYSAIVTPSPFGRQRSRVRAAGLELLREFGETTNRAKATDERNFGDLQADSAVTKVKNSEDQLRRVVGRRSAHPAAEPTGITSSQGGICRVTQASDQRVPHLPASLCVEMRC